MKIMPKKVLVGGVFNVIHPGHIFFLKKAKKFGDYLIVVVASNRTAYTTKKYPVFDAKVRKKNLEKLDFVDKVVIGDDYDFMKIVRKEKPDFIVLGCDQKINENKLKKMILKAGLKCKIIRIKEKLKGYSTSKIMEIYIKNNRHPPGCGPIRPKNSH